jgi:hypothetical protein
VALDPGILLIAPVTPPIAPATLPTPLTAQVIPAIVPVLQGTVLQFLLRELGLLILRRVPQ